MVWTRRCSRISPCREANNRKDKLPKFEQSKFLNFELSPLNDCALYGKPVRGGTDSWLVAPLLCFESAQQLKRAASSRDMVSCRKQRRQQAAEVPHSALAARVPAPASFPRKRRVDVQREVEQEDSMHYLFEIFA